MYLINFDNFFISLQFIGLFLSIISHRLLGCILEGTQQAIKVMNNAL